MEKKIVLVTGANKGIGYEICRQLAKKKKPEFEIILTSRSESLGHEAVSRLKKEGLNAVYHPLDVTQQASIETLKNFISKQYGHLDVLINNAGIFIERESDGAPALEAKRKTIEQTLETNLFGPLALIQALAPLIKKSEAGRIINISSGMGQLSEMTGGYPGYRISKAGLNALTRMFADELMDDEVAVNSVCPGWVKTDMGGSNAERSVEQGADTAVWLASEADQKKTGLFFRDRKEIDW